LIHPIPQTQKAENGKLTIMSTEKILMKEWNTRNVLMLCLDKFSIKTYKKRSTNPHAKLFAIEKIIVGLNELYLLRNSL